MTKLYMGREHRTNWFIWLAAVVCAFFAVAVFITGVVVLSVYLIYRPKMPFIRVASAQLVSLGYDQSGLLDTRMNLDMEAVNNNAKALASFSNLALNLHFSRAPIAELRAEPFDVPENSSLQLPYVVVSTSVPLDEAEMEDMDAALKSDRIPFRLSGQTRTRWRIGVYLTLKLYTHLDCNLYFSRANGSSIDLYCSSESR